MPWEKQTCVLCAKSPSFCAAASSAHALTYYAFLMAAPIHPAPNLASFMESHGHSLASVGLSAVPYYYNLPKE